MLTKYTMDNALELDKAEVGDTFCLAWKETLAESS